MNSFPETWSICSGQSHLKTKTMLNFTEIRQIGTPDEPDFSCEIIIPWLLLFMGCAILVFWIIEIVKTRKLLQRNSLQWKNENNENMWFHVAAELITSILLISAGIANWTGNSATLLLTLFSAGLLFYASLNSLSWVFVEKSRLKLAIPMIAGIIVSIFIVICCLI